MKIFRRNPDRALERLGRELATPPVTQKRKQAAPGMILANLVTVLVGAAAGFVSWQHLSELGRRIGATSESAFLTPFTIDGMILAGTLELRQARKEGRPAKVWAYVAVLIGVVGTIAGNVRAARAGDLTAQLYYAAPALAFLICVEVLFGKPLSRNLWDLIRSAWARHRRSKQVENTPTTPDRESGPVPVTVPETPATPQPDNTPETAQPVEDPTPQKPVSPPESPADGLDPLPKPLTPAKPRTPGRRAAGKPSAGKSTAVLTGTRQNPARLVDGVVLEGEALREDARKRVRDAYAINPRREGLGAWVARQYAPPMSDNWGLDRVREVLDAPAEPAPAPGAPDPTWGQDAPAAEPDAPFIGPLPVTEQAVPLDDAPEREPATV